MLKKIFVGIMIFCLTITSCLVIGGGEASASGQMKPLPGAPGWKYRVDGPHVDGVNNDWHVHVEKGSIKGAETVKGGESHNKTLSSAGVPKTVQKKVKETSEYKRALEKQKKLDKERDKASKFSWKTIIIKPYIYLAAVATAAGLTVWQIIKAGPRFIFA
ncbi:MULTISPECIES: hypothetical protein [Bacillales]|uniref:Uncharacterized protein n=1 Tax=Lysinibacillus halotolerans TaxID=1368476 RepID=A0A3M8H180_9BACI|nr:hypothetical protein [Lysinibacillus halotolerans]RNC96201.1 hypothetical protein EC501_17380 [Lysinibacillus halotolerans]